jgi:hypothetical protein
MNAFDIIKHILLMNMHIPGEWSCIKFPLFMIQTQVFIY